MYHTEIKTLKARKVHQCTSCAEDIVVGELYALWTSFGDSVATSKMHLECLAAHQDAAPKYGYCDGWEYTPYSHPRGGVDDQGA